jgi:hypothetical protein
MRRLRQGLAPAKAAVVLASCGLAAAIGGCATSASEPPAAQVVAQATRTQMEDDGLPPQVAPSVRIRQQPDDPTEPFSPNYGPRPAGRPAPPAMRLSPAEEDAIVMRAIVAHETRRP